MIGIEAEGLEHRDIQSFSMGDGRWVTAAESCTPLHAASFSVATQNTWFNELAWKERANGLLTAIEAANVDFVCLQEVTPRLLNHLRSTPFVRENFRCVCSSKVAVASSFGYGHGYGDSHGYGTMILSRLPISVAWELEFDSRMHRTLLVAEVPTASGMLTIATSHLESTRPFRNTRVAQMRTVFSILREVPDVVFVGDFNFDPSEPEEHEVDQRFDDVWRLLRPGDPGFTEDTVRNPMRFQNHQKEKQVRYDRILAKLSHWHPTEIRLFADRHLNDQGLCVSDHFGVSASFSSTAS
jgi:endonuclease/exonuclease/phosphatase family metal-dependent hydrolase